MKRYIILAIILLFSVSIAQKNARHSTKNIVYDSTYQLKIHKNLPKYLIRFFIVEGKNEGGETACLFSIATHSSSDKKLIDSVFYSTKNFETDDLKYIFSKEDYNDAKPQFMDINFDGYLDIRIVSSKYNYYDFSYSFLLFNPKKSNYQFSEEFTDVCNNAQIDEEKKEISVTSATERDCGYCWKESTYRVVNNHPILYQLVTSELATVDGVSKQKQTTQRLVNGTMVIVNVELTDVVN